MKTYQQKWKEKNIDKYRDYQREYIKKRRLEPRFSLDALMATSTCEVLKGMTARRKWQTLVDYTAEDLVKHFEKQFDDKMTWDNQGSYWHIDHINPKSSFKYETVEDPEFKECWALENLRPLEKTANYKKGNK